MSAGGGAYQLYRQKNHRPGGRLRSFLCWDQIGTTNPPLRQTRKLEREKGFENNEREKKEGITGLCIDERRSQANHVPMASYFQMDSKYALSNNRVYLSPSNSNIFFVTSCSSAPRSSCLRYSSLVFFQSWPL